MYVERNGNQFLGVIILSIIIISTLNKPAFSENSSKYKSILSELQYSFNSDNKENTYKAILKLKELKSEIPLSLVLSEIKGKAKDPKNASYVCLLADFTGYMVRYIGKDSFVSSFSDFEEIIKNKNEQIVIRRNIISALTKGFILNKLGEERENSKINIIPLLTDIINDKKEDTKVVAQAINSLSRIKYDGINNELLNMVENWEVEDPFKVQSASESLGRSKVEKAIPLLINIINFTDNIDIFVTAVYSLGLMESFEIIEPSLNNYDRFNQLGRSACRGALRKNKELLIKIIAKEKSGPMIPSIIALGKIKEKSALPYLDILLNENILDKNIILNTIKQIKNP